MTQKRSLKPTDFQPASQATRAKRERLRPSAAKIGLTLLGVAFAAALAFVFTAKSLTVTVNQAPKAEVTLTGGFSVKFGGRFLLLPGDYTVAITAAGFRPAEIPYTATRDDSQQLQVELTPLPGKITFNLNPRNATVQIDGESV